MSIAAGPRGALRKIALVQPSINLEQFDIESPSGRAAGGCASCGLGEPGAGDSRCGNGLEKIYPTTAVRFGYMRYIGEYSHPPDMKFTCGAKIVILSKRGLEIGDQVSLTCSGCDKAVTREQMKEWVRRCGDDSFIFDAGRILREATAGDLAEYARIQVDCKEKRAFAQEVARRHKLPLKIAECEHLFGGERIIFFFTANERVDFRAMVKDLAREYRTRIEMRQIGARDEARLLADFETCGQELCCKVFLKTLRPISMRMAKLQKATLDPTQVSGRCGRLKCCLRYEHDSYEDLDKRLPKIGTRIGTGQGDGVIVNRQVLTQLVQVRMDDDTLVTVVAEDITEAGLVPAVPVKEPRPPRGGDRGGRGRGSGRGDGPRRDRPAKAEPPAETGTPKSDGQAAPEAKPGPGETPVDGDKPADGESAESAPRRRARRRRRPRRRGGGGGENAGGSAPSGDK